MKRILIVDGDADVAAVISDLLTGEGYRCTCSTAPGEAALLVKAGKADLLLLDARLTREFGAGEARSVPVVLMSTTKEPRHAAPFWREFLPKPFDIEALLAAVRR